MREADRPAEERLSVLDRPHADTDALPAQLLADPERAWAKRLDETTVRLALVVDDHQIWIARGADDAIFQFFFDSHGGGISGGPRSVLRSHGAAVGWNSNQHRRVVHGIVPDPVIAVRVGDVDAIVANNAFMAEVGSGEGPVVLTTRAGERAVPGPGALPRERRPAARGDGPGYVGVVEYAWSGYPTIEIDDLDSPNWQGTPTGGFLIHADAPEVWFVGVVLLEGSRAGELATADLLVPRDVTGPAHSVRLSGRTAFGPHPDPPRLDAARRQLAELRGRFDPPGPA